MFSMTAEKILQAVGGKLLSGHRDAVASGVSTDSRSISKGQLFIPLIGEHFDGHDFISQALEKEASGFLTSKAHVVSDRIREQMDKNGQFAILVSDTLKALQQLAQAHRMKFDIPFVAITGSVGKTSTKDMIAGVLGKKYKVLSTRGNLNNEIGLPLMLLELDASHEAAVLEMGMSGFGEIAVLSRLVRPDIAVITNIGLSHIEKLGSRQNILKAKTEIFEGLKKEGLAVLNGDDDLLPGLKNLLPFRTVFYGMTDESADLHAYNLQNLGENGIRFSIMHGGKEYTVSIPVPGIHNLYNALAAIAVGIELNIPMESIVEGIASFTPGKMRQNIFVTSAGLKVINDTYNASPASLKAALNVLHDLEGERKIAVLGDILEMGEWAPEAHREVGCYVAETGTDYLITVGENARYYAEGAKEAGMSSGKVISFDTTQQANAYLEKLVKKGDVLLVKGSRGMKMEQIVEFISHL